MAQYGKFHNLEEWKTFFTHMYLGVEYELGVVKAEDWLKQAEQICIEDELFEQCMHITDLLLDNKIRQLVAGALGEEILDTMLLN